MTTAVSARLAHQELVPNPARGRWAGLGNLLRKELGQWWGTRRWWIQAIIWTGLVAGVSTIVMADSEGMTPVEHGTESMLTFFGLGVIAVGIGIVVSVQGSVIGEKELGTAAWVMSKPVSRDAFVVAKIVAETAGFLLTGVLLPAAGFLISARFLLPVPLDYGRFAMGLGVSALAVAFYVTLTVALGTAFAGRGPVAGIGIGFILAGQLLKNVLPAAVVARTPWILPEAAAALAMPTAPIQLNPLPPILVTAVLTIALGMAAVWRFRREEF